MKGDSDDGEKEGGVDAAHLALPPGHSSASAHSPQPSDQIECLLWGQKRGNFLNSLPGGT
jgi:hypothetical protein